MAARTRNRSGGKTMIQKNSVVIENPTKDVKETLLKGYKKSSVRKHLF